MNVDSTLLNITSSGSVPLEAPRYSGFIILVFLLGLGIYFMNNLPDFKEIQANWPKYRCSPQVMPFASFYGHDTKENFQYCMKNIFSTYAGEILGPFYGILGGFVKVLINLIKSANSIRVMFGTLMGGVTTIFQEFTSRFSQFTCSCQHCPYEILNVSRSWYHDFCNVYGNCGYYIRPEFRRHNRL